ncbi:hypothetical protein [Saccharomonospora glauca]|jgi:hypothetical protein|uniref:Uncharacterized protein n=1 Tax=Saccharomonospora glauca K62 TaxID=928724 RepID=I1CZE2_9PSEU|nr:hypothetical protein [Saccharomonospora glauca]EIE98066.1 hypothetical protein SacglDRAFT_01133 [Saccharomonospora glauca K62]
MGWSDFHRRRDIMDKALAAAMRDKEARIPFDRIEGAREFFDTEEDLLLALQHRWQQILTGHLRAEVAGPEDASTVPGGESDEHHDHVDAVSRAWRRAVRNHPELDTVLSANSERFPALRRAREAELRLLAVTSGLAEPHEPEDEVTDVGATLVALLRYRDTPVRARGVNLLGHWLRRLAPTA